MAACEEILSNCVLALAGSLGSLVLAVVAVLKAHSAEKTAREK